MANLNEIPPMAVQILKVIRARLIDDLQHHCQTARAFSRETEERIIKYRFRVLVESYRVFNENFFELEINNAQTNQLGPEDLTAMFAENRRLENLYFETKDYMISLIEELDDTNAEPAPSRPQLHTSMFHSTLRGPQAESPNQHRNAGKLPPLAIKKFSGRIEDWEEFADLFMSLITNNALLPEVQKMHYLKSSLSDGPARIIKHLPVTAQSFLVAWNLLTEAYMSKRGIVEANLELFFNAPNI